MRLVKLLTLLILMTVGKIFLYDGTMCGYIHRIDLILKQRSLSSDVDISRDCLKVYLTFLARLFNPPREARGRKLIESLDIPSSLILVTELLNSIDPPLKIITTVAL